MSQTLRNGLIIGIALGLAIAWSNWPQGAEATDARIARSVGQVIGATAMVLLVALLIGRMSKR